MSKRKKGNEGKVYYGNTKNIERDTKPRRRYVVVNDNGVNVKVSKLKSIKTDGANTNPNLYELDRSKYPKLKQRTGVHNQVFTDNRVNREKLRLGKSNGVFDDKADFELNDLDFGKVAKRIQKAKYGKKKKGKGPKPLA